MPEPSGSDGKSKEATSQAESGAGRGKRTGRNQEKGGKNHRFNKQRLKIQITNAVARSPVHEDRIRNIEVKPMSMT